MNPVGDAFTVGIVLLLLIGAVAFYLYTRLTQVEKRIGLLETILLDLKVATENSFMGFPVSGGRGRGGDHRTEADADEEELLSEYVPKLPTSHLGGAIEAEELAADETDMYERALESALDDAVESGGADIQDADAEEEGGSEEAMSKAVAVDASAVASNHKSDVHVNKLEPNYSSMSVKELRQLAQNHGVTGVAKLSRKELVETLQKKDSGILEGIESSAALGGFESSLVGAAASIDA